MGMFKQLEGEAAILVENGVYKQVDIYTRDGDLYAKSSGGFVKLNADASTSKARCRLDTISIEKDLYRSKLGWLRVDDKDGGQLLEGPKKQKLLGGVS